MSMEPTSAADASQIDHYYSVHLGFANVKMISVMLALSLLRLIIFISW